ncbi:hypothetical protein D9756_000434 [Leucocoprinus leucothites]|uniref:Uncharacterized protein n=1 Tax=Leucocoprinus leucothites TaxID=201217 RepID=A0A8H5LNN8_9AGAR|nr:hypothetical protein D9756_000434 [Leucoagaricus leucothites]
MTTPTQSPTTAGRFSASNPSTPTKARVTAQSQQSPMAGSFGGSPASTFSSSTTTGTPSGQPDASQTPFRSLFAAAKRSSAPAEPQRQLYVRADPTLLTCFDPADKELYDLWAPKR